MLLSVEGSGGDEDSHWTARARYHFRNEEYWRDRALTAERELEQLKISSKELEFKISSISRCCE